MRGAKELQNGRALVGNVVDGDGALALRQLRLHDREPPDKILNGALCSFPFPE